MKLLKFCACVLISLTLLSQTSRAQTQNSDRPQYLTLIFEDQLLTLDFRTHPNLLHQTVTHYLLVGEQKVPVSFGETLPPSTGIAPLKTEFTTSINPEALKKFFRTTAIVRDKSKSPPVNLSLEGSTVTFSDRPTTGHYDIDQPRLVALLNQALRTNSEYVRVPAQKAFAPVVASTELQERGIKSVIALGRSNFTGSSPSRVQNILAAARKFDGLIIPKGRTFSFNHTLGSVEEKDGFVEELVIKGNETVKELGGGVCQVSTTVFRAAFSAGLPIVSRRNHSYAVPYYKPHGLDATIYLGGQDFRFKNDTPGDIAVQSFVSDEDLYFVFYGSEDGRRVAVEGPFISNYRPAPEPQVIETPQLPFGQLVEASPSHDGFSAEWVRRVWKPGERTSSEEVLRSSYRPWAARIMQGIGSSEQPLSEFGQTDFPIEETTESARQN